jgi:hypothetical protein
MTRIVHTQLLNGGMIDLLQPLAIDVDFREIADTLARINRYAGNAVKTVSVAQHTLIAIDAAPPVVKPWVALHDAHEARFGDITTPAAKAIEIIAGRIRHGGDIAVRDAIAHLKELHDIAIHSAARLPMPTAAQRIAIRQADQIALTTERRDFLSAPAIPWGQDDGSEPQILRKVYRLMSPADAADRLYAAFRELLPALQCQSQNARSEK